MSNREYPNSGYVIRADKLVVLLKEEDRQEYLDALEDGKQDNDFTKAFDILWSQLPEDNLMCMPHTLFMLCDTDTPGENLEYGVVYAVFNENDLYEYIATVNLNKFIDKIGETPQHSNWSIWG